MSFPEPPAGAGHNFADKEASWGDFTVTPSVSLGMILMTISDPAGMITTTKMSKAILGDAIDQWLVTNAAQLATNGVVVGNDPATATIGGKNVNRPPGDGYYGWIWDQANKTGNTPAITTTGLTTAAITVTIPYADVC